MPETSRYDVSGDMKPSTTWVVGGSYGTAGNYPESEMVEAEAREQKRVEKYFLFIFDLFKTADIFSGCTIYGLAGFINGQGSIGRSIFLMSLPFCSAGRIPIIVKGFEKGHLSRLTPCLFSTQPEVVRALAVVHTEMVLIHPSGKDGRMARMLAIVMAVQAGLPPLDFGSFERTNKA